MGEAMTDVPTPKEAHASIHNGIYDCPGLCCPTLAALRQQRDLREQERQEAYEEGYAHGRQHATGERP